MPSKSNAPKKLRNRRPTSPSAALSAARLDAGTSLISSAAAVDAMISASVTSWLP
jgi:hypothetical protein